MARARSTTPNLPEDLAAPGRVRIRSRLGACRCGCQGTDPWHATFFDRVVRDVEVLPSPAPVGPERASLGDVRLMAVARGVARFPWGEEPVVAVAWSGRGTLTSWVEWERADLRGGA